MKKEITVGNTAAAKRYEFMVTRFPREFLFLELMNSWKPNEHPADFDGQEYYGFRCENPIAEVIDIQSDLFIGDYLDLFRQAQVEVTNDGNDFDFLVSWPSIPFSSTPRFLCTPFIQRDNLHFNAAEYLVDKTSKSHACVFSRETSNHIMTLDLHKSHVTGFTFPLEHFDSVVQALYGAYCRSAQFPDFAQVGI